MTPRWKSILGVTLIFLLGCAAGVLASSAFFMHRTALFLQRGAPAYVEVLERRFTRGLHLDPDQKQKIHALFMSNLEQRQRLQKTIQPQIRNLNVETVREVRSILRPDQTETFRRNVMEFRHRLGREKVDSPALDALGPDPAGTPTTNSPPQ